jgi:hypothetical protein
MAGEAARMDLIIIGAQYTLNKGWLALCQMWSGAYLTIFVDVQPCGSLPDSNIFWFNAGGIGLWMCRKVGAISQNNSYPPCGG